MHIAGLQKMTLLDYPGQVACTIFIQGCNFRCPFCHNSDLLPGQGQAFMTAEELLRFLQSRRGLLDAVCVTGGEPTLQPELETLLREIKALGYLVKLDTNGSRPEFLKHLAEEKLLDYVAMDIKNGPQAYDRTTGCKTPLSAVEESMAFLLTGDLPYEFRTTVVRELHDREDFQSMAQWLKAMSPNRKVSRFYLQVYTDRDSVLQEGLHAPDKKELEEYAEILSAVAEQVALRGVD